MNFTPRPTTYKGIEMRSRLEAGFAAWLDQRGAKWSYEPRAFASEVGQYLPDFRVENVLNVRSGVRSHGYVEIKPKDPSPEQRERIAAQFSVIKASEPDAHCMLIWPGYEWHGSAAIDVLWPLAHTEPTQWMLVPQVLLATPEGFGFAWKLPPAGRPWFGDYWQVQP